MHLSCSKYGWMNSDLFIEFIRDVFHPHVMQNHGLSIPVISFIDGHSSHLSLDACLLCDKLDIILVKLYPNYTFLTQLADVSCFRSLKSIWRKTITNYRGDDVSKVVTKAAFGHLTESSFAQLTVKTIIKGDQEESFHGKDKTLIISNVWVKRTQYFPIQPYQIMNQ